MQILFEYDCWESISNKKELLSKLQGIWQKTRGEYNYLNNNEYSENKYYQPFLSFNESEIRANNFVGFIQNGDSVIEIYPKVFKNVENARNFKTVMFRHILFWLKYCRKWKFPFTNSNLDNLEIDSFPELFINLITTQILDTISTKPLMIYQQFEETLEAPRESINFSRYIRKGFSHGNLHQIECDVEPLLFNNKTNRVIKYCSRLLLSQTRINTNQRIIGQILSIFDEVDDLPCTLDDLRNDRFSPFFEDYLDIINLCKMVLNNQLYTSNSFELSQWCVLLPMEYIFEDFVAGFLAAKFQKDWNVEYQKSDKYLATNNLGENVFNMQHDIFLTSKTNPTLKIIVDTKYKLRPLSFKSDSKKGISQNDLYQMVSYAFARGCSNAILIYPNISEQSNDPDQFQIMSLFEGTQPILVTTLEIPFWSFKNLQTLPDLLEKKLLGALKSIRNSG